MTRTQKQLRHTAIHEAGHAVIGRVLKQVCGHATIRQNRKEGEAGHVIVADPCDTLEHWWKIERYRGHDEYDLRSCSADHVLHGRAGVRGGGLGHLRRR